MSRNHSGWTPKLVALDIDGTLLAWVEGSGASYEQVTPKVNASVRAARDTGAHIVLCSGRSPHGMIRIIDLLGLYDEGAEPLWVVSSNGAVVFRYPPLDVVHEETFDAREAVRAVLAEHPEALVAVEERGVGYRLNRPFPDGELSGEMIVAELDQMIAEPVSRVIIRDPQATAEEFIDLADRLGLQGTDYVVGWTAWLDLSPVGVNKASGLAVACERMGVAQADVLALGDGRNDLEMLRWAGRGVAMGQAVDEVRAAADDVTASVYDDGVAVELDQWFTSAPGGPPPKLGSQRLDLPLIGAQDAADMRAGHRQPGWHEDFPREDDLDAIGLVGPGADKGGWGPRFVVRRDDGLVVGSMGFFGPPSGTPPETEVGYGLVADARGQGLATEALRALLAETDRLGVRVRASVLPDNAASVRVLAKCGFTEVRGSTVDGELVMARPLP